MTDAEQRGRRLGDTAFLKRNPGCDAHEGTLTIWFAECFEHGYDQRNDEDLCDPFKDKVAAAASNWRPGFT